MPTQYKYKAVSADGRKHKGSVSVENRQQVIDFLGEQALIPIEVKSTKKKKHLSFWGFFSDRDYENLIMFTNNLATLFKSGIPVLKALTLIKIGPPQNRFNQIISQVKFQMQAGASLSKSMAEFDHVFSTVYTSSIAAGEESGKLDDILDEIGPVLQRELELNRQIKSAIRYPAMVVLALAAAFTVMITMVVPKFVSFYNGFQSELPLPTRILTATSDFVIGYWPVVLALVILIAFAYRKLVSTEEGRYWVDCRAARMPVFGELIIKGNVARFAVLFSILFKAGVPIVQALDILADSVKNTAIGREIRRMGSFFQSGQEQKLNRQEFDYIPELCLQMISIGLESGSLENILKELGIHYSKDVSYTTRQLTSILEPILTLVLGVFVLILALAIFLPMWNLIHVFKG